MDEFTFEIEVPRSFFGPVRLSGGKLLAGDRVHNALVSEDGGRTWNNMGPMTDGRREPICSGADRPGFASSTIRLVSGAIGLKFDDRLMPQGGLNCVFSSHFTRSIDEGYGSMNMCTVFFCGVRAGHRFESGKG